MKGWQAVDAAAFVDLVGPVLRRSSDNGLQFGLLIEDKHSNRSGFAHGGVITALLDVALGLTAKTVEQRKQATLSLSVQFLAPVRVGEFLIAECSVVKRTRSIMFMQGSFRVDDRICATAQGAWKILQGQNSNPV